MMTSLKLDISLTLLVKIILLVILWWTCVKGMHHDLTPTKEWLLGSKPQLIEKT